MHKALGFISSITKNKQEIERKMPQLAAPWLGWTWGVGRGSGGQALP
jgi:hypothetical protein